MTFITLLLCLSLERFLYKNNLLARFNWFERYVSKVNQLTQNMPWTQHHYISLLLIIVPLAILIAVIYYLSAFFIHGLLAFLIGAFVLFYCFGPTNIYETQTPHQGVFWQANEALFAVIFWYALLGPVAAIIYRLVERSAHIHASYPALAKPAGQVRAVLDWLPIRLFSILFALAGNFIQTSRYWLDHFVARVANREFIENAGRIALDMEESVPLTQESYPQSRKLIDRSLILFLIIVFAVTIGVLL
jgi:AmpE protein